MSWWYKFLALSYTYICISPHLGQRITIYNTYSQPIHTWYKWYWYNYHLEQYDISNRIHINPARSQPYPNPKYISFNNGIRGDNSGTFKKPACHYSDVIMSTMTSQITGDLIVYSTVCWGTDQRKHQSFASLAIVWGIHRWIPHTKGQ